MHAQERTVVCGGSINLTVITALVGCADSIVVVSPLIFSTQAASSNDQRVPCGDSIKYSDYWNIVSG